MRPAEDYVWLRIADIKVEGRFRKNLGDLKALARSIKQLGLLQPIVVTKATRRLVCGERRLRAVQMNGEETILCHLLDIADADIPKAVAAENVEGYRDDLTPAERRALKRDLRREREQEGSNQESY
jgi:ParB family chromosome partitioning protein